MEDRSRMTDCAFVGKMGIAAFSVIGLILVVVRVSQNLVDRSAGHYQVSPRLANAYGYGLPRPVAVRIPAASVLPPEHPDRELLDAIRVKEDYRDDRKVGPDGERGPYQITEAYWIDACDYAYINYNSYDWWYETHVYDPDKCEFIFWLYMLRYLGSDASDYRKARAHNGGPEDGQDIRSHVYAREVLNIKLAMGGE